MSIDTLEKNILNVHQEAGRIWLDHLPDTLNKLCKLWRLDSPEPIQNMTYHYVARAHHTVYGPVVIKVGPDPDVFQRERDALNHFHGSGCISVHEANAELSALLLQAADPGKSLLTLLYKNPPKALAGYAKAFLSLHHHPTTPHPKFHAFPLRHVKEWLQSIQDETLNRLPLPIKRVSQQIVTELLQSTDRDHFMHGDLHADNILSHQGTWVAIDPKGVIGDLAFEASCFEFVTRPELNSDIDVKTMLLDRIHALSHMLSLDPSHLLKWVFIRNALHTNWHIEDGTNADRNSAMCTLILQLL